MSNFTKDHVLFAVGGQCVPESAKVSTPEDLVSKIRFSHQKTVVLVIHGGLVSTSDAVETAASVHGLLQDVSYPIYVAWETGAAFGLFPPAAPEPKPRYFKADPAPADSETPYPLGDAERRLEVNTRSIARSIWGRTKNYSKYTNDPDNKGAAMNRFMTAFVPLWKERNLRVVIVAHSAGAIFTGNWLEALDRWNPNGKVDVLFMAPACTYSFVHRRIDAFSKHISQFRMLALSDKTERYDALFRLKVLPKNVQGWYDASMLYFVSNNLEGPRDVPLLGMERFWRLATDQSVESPRTLTDVEGVAISEVGEALNLKENTVWSNGLDEAESSPRPGAQGWECRSPGHTGFWADPATRRSIRAFAAGS